VHHSLTHGRKNEVGDRDSSVPRARLSRHRRHHGDRKSAGRLLLIALAMSLRSGNVLGIIENTHYKFP
jgi:hypothetical protein